MLTYRFCSRSTCIIGGSRSTSSRTEAKWPAGPNGLPRLAVGRFISMSINGEGAPVASVSLVLISLAGSRL